MYSSAETKVHIHFLITLHGEIFDEIPMPSKSKQIHLLINPYMQLDIPKRFK